MDPSSKVKGKNPLEAFADYLRDAEKVALSTWTYREVCRDVMIPMKWIVESTGSRLEAEATRARLRPCLRLARALSERDPSLSGVVTSLEHLALCIDATRDLTSDVVLAAFEMVLLDVKFCMSQHD